MDIQNSSPAGPSRSNPLRGREASESAAGASSPSSPQTDAPGQSGKASDRVEISNSARQAQTGSDIDPADAALAERGREALGASSLSEERLGELKQRVADGHYATPAAAEQIAEQMTGGASNA